MSDWFKFHNDALDSKGMQYAISEQPLVTSVWLVILSEASKNRAGSFSWFDQDFELIGFSRKLNISLPVFNQCLNLLERIGYIVRKDGRLTVPGWDGFQSDYARGLNRGYYKKTSEKLASNSLDTSARGEERRGDIIHTHTSAEVPTLTEVKAYASLHGIKPESAQAFYDHHEGNQLWVNQHGKLINWQHKLAAWAAKDRAMPSKTAQDASKPVGGTTEAIIRQRELDDVTKQIATIRARDEHMSYSEAEKAKLKQLKARQAELKGVLGWKA